MTCTTEVGSPHRVTRFLSREPGELVGHLPELMRSQAYAGQSDASELGRLVGDQCRGLRADRPYVGVAAAILDAEGVPHTHVEGFADVEAGALVDTRTVFGIGSVTKVVIAIAVMRLVGTGLLELDDPVSAHLTNPRLLGPDGRVAPVTIRQLLAHSSGLQMGGGRRDRFRPRQAMPPLTEWCDGVLECATNPGAVVAGSNVGYAVLGQLLCEVLGRSLSACMRDEIFAPLGMLSSVVPEGWEPVENLARSYEVSFGDVRVLEQRRSVLVGGGGGFASLDDLCRLLGFLIHRDPRLLRPDLVDLMLAEQGPAASPLNFSAEGLGFGVRRHRGGRVAGKTGGYAGFYSYVWFAPETKVGFAACTNTSSGIAVRLGDAVAAELLGPVESVTDRPGGQAR